MTTPIERMVDAHVHLWDPARTEWYPYLSGRRELNMGDISAMCRRFDWETYRSESSRWNVEKIVHVAAAASPFYVDETLELDRLAAVTGHPAAIVGGLVATAPVAETVALLDRHAASPRFRGVRPGGGDVGHLPPAEVLRELQDRRLVLDLMAHPDQHHAAARALAEWSDLTMVVNHAGWPRADSAEERARWRKGVAELAALGGNVYCKLSGLAMPLRTMNARTFEPWIAHCLEVFGVDRCLFASNFPVDGIAGTFDQLYDAYDSVTAQLDPADREKLFAANAEAVYRC